MGISRALTNCFGKNKNNSNGATADEEPYGTIPNLSDKKNSSTKQKNTKNIQATISKTKKKVSFSWANNKRRSCSDSTGPTYDYIDAETDPVYSKVEENLAQRYDYPTFSAARSGQCRKSREEPLYTSASQIYSATSEDPYSSIMSESETNKNAENNSAVYESGYAKLNLENSKSSKSLFRNSKASTSQRDNEHKNLDSLYAKINRQSNGVLRGAEPHLKEVPIAVPIRSALPNGLVQPNFIPILMASTSTPGTSSKSTYQLEESGSGSIVSNGSSQNPSYRYLTVRESVDVVRERIRRRELERAAQNQHENKLTGCRFPQREHYYSTIANEYESVSNEGSADGIFNGSSRLRGEPFERFSTIGLDEIRPSTSSALPLTLTPPLTLNTDRFENGLEAPKPPTSPIPNRVPEPATIIRPVILSPPISLFSDDGSASRMSTSYNSIVGTSQNDKGNYNKKTNSNPNLMAVVSRPPPLPPTAFRHSQTSATNVGYSSNRNSFYDPRSSLNELPPPPPLPPSAARTPIPLALRLSYANRSTGGNIATPTRLFTDHNISEVEKNLKDEEKRKLQKGTSTKEEKETVEMQTQTQPSRIPIPKQSNNTLVCRTPSPTSDISTQTNSNRNNVMATSQISQTSSNFMETDLEPTNSVSGRMSKKRKEQKLSPPPQPIGNDYISTVDLSNGRAWPLTHIDKSNMP